MVWQRDQRDQRATGKHPSTVQSSSSNLHPVVKNSSADVPGTAEDPAAVHGAQQVALRSKKPSEYPSMWGEKIWENRYVTRGWLWSITRNDFHDMTYGRIDYWMVLNGVEWCWMNHLLLDRVFAFTLHDGLAMTCIYQCEIAGSQLCPACHWRPTARLTSSGWLPNPAQGH